MPTRARRRFTAVRTTRQSYPFGAEKRHAPTADRGRARSRSANSPHSLRAAPRRLDTGARSRPSPTSATTSTLTYPESTMSAVGPRRTSLPTRCSSESGSTAWRCCFQQKGAVCRICSNAVLVSLPPPREFGYYANVSLRVFRKERTCESYAGRMLSLARSILRRLPCACTHFSDARGSICLKCRGTCVFMITPPTSSGPRECDHDTCQNAQPLSVN